MEALQSKQKALHHILRRSIFISLDRFNDTLKGLLLKNEVSVDILMYVQNTGITTAL